MNQSFNGRDSKQIDDAKRHADDVKPDMKPANRPNWPVAAADDMARLVR